MEDLPIEQVKIVKAACEDAIGAARKSKKWCADPLQSLAYVALMTLDIALGELIKDHSARKGGQ